MYSCPEAFITCSPCCPLYGNVMNDNCFLEVWLLFSKTILIIGFAIVVVYVHVISFLLLFYLC